MTGFLLNEYVLYIVFFVGFIATQVLENWFRERERFVNLPGAGTKWHHHQWLGWILIFGYLNFLMFDEWTAIRVLFLSAAVWWIFFDGWLNALKGRDWFYQSKQTSSTLEKYATAELKLILLFVAVALLVFAGCSPSVRYVDRVTVDTVVVVPPVIQDSLKATAVTDTVIISNKIVESDTVIDVRYYPKEQKFFVKVKPDTVRVLRVDTVTQVQVIGPAEKEPEWYERWWVWAILFVAFFIGWRINQ